MVNQDLVAADESERESGTKANIKASTVGRADTVCTTLRPRRMSDVVFDAAKATLVKNDGNAAFHEMDVGHPAAKSMVGDRGTAWLVLAGEMLRVAEAFIHQNYCSTVIYQAFIKVLDDALVALERIAINVDVMDRGTMLVLVKSSIGTRFTSQFRNLIADLAIDATFILDVDLCQGLREVDIKKYIKVEKVPGGHWEDSKVLNGVMFNKDVVAPGKMRRKIRNPRIILLDSPIEYKQAENQTNAELLREEDQSFLLKMEEEYIENLCMQILKFKPNLVITEKGLSDLACHYFSNAGVTAICRLRKTDINRIARACGAVIVNKPGELQESDVGTGAGLFEVRKFGDEFFCFIVDCKDPKACTILVRGASQDLLDEVERNLQDVMSVARNIIKNPKLVPGGDATERAVSAMLKRKSSFIEGVEMGPYKAAANAFHKAVKKDLTEAISRMLAQEYWWGGGIRFVFKRKHVQNAWSGIYRNPGGIGDTKECKMLWDFYADKAHEFKTGIDIACMLLGTEQCGQQNQ